MSESTDSLSSKGLLTETKRSLTLTMVGHRSAGDGQTGVFLQRPSQGQQPKDAEGKQRMHGSIVQTERNFIIPSAVTHRGAKTSERHL